MHGVPAQHDSQSEQHETDGKEDLDECHPD